MIKDWLKIDQWIINDYIYLNLIKQGLPWTSEELTVSMMADGKNIKIPDSNIFLPSDYIQL